MANIPVKTTETTLRIIDGLRELEGATVTELATHLDSSKSTVYNHVSTLKKNEYVTKDESGNYYLGCRFLELGESARDRHTVYGIAQPEVEKLAEQTGEISGLLVEEHGRGVFLYREKGESAVHIDTHTGKRVLLHTSALGKSILAFLDEERVEEIIDRHGLPAMTDSTITDRDQLFDELETIREEHIAFDDEERIRGLRSVASPILANTDEIIGSVSVAGPTTRIKGDRFREEIPEQVQNSANVIELNVSYT